MEAQYSCVRQLDYWSEKSTWRRLRYSISLASCLPLLSSIIPYWYQRSDGFSMPIHRSPVLALPAICGYTRVFLMPVLDD
eukprot:3213350-Rhodomonas_salina.2